MLSLSFNQIYDHFCNRHAYYHCILCHCKEDNAHAEHEPYVHECHSPCPGINDKYWMRWGGLLLSKREKLHHCWHHLTVSLIQHRAAVNHVVLNALHLEFIDAFTYETVSTSHSKIEMTCHIVSPRGSRFSSIYRVSILLGWLSWFSLKFYCTKSPSFHTYNSLQRNEEPPMRTLQRFS